MIAPKLDTSQTTAVGSLPTIKADMKDSETLTLILLPSELLIEILRHVDGQSISRCSSVCRKLNRVIDSSTELQYHIELALDCMLDGPRSTVTVAERLEQLRTLRRAWTLFEWKKEVQVPMHGGVFAKTSSPAGIHNQSGPRKFISSWLPSSSDPGHTLVRKDIGISTRDFAIDPSQDLIALVQCDDDFVNNSSYTDVHIRTISSNVKHPEASSPVIRTLTQSTMTSAFIQIVDDVIGMMFWMEFENPRITIWNWKTGQILVDRDGDDLPSHISDFSFISNRAYMITIRTDGGSIQVFTFGEKQHEIVHVASLSLPPMKSTHLVHCTIHTGPFVARCLPNTPFWTNQEERMYVLSVQYVQVDMNVPSARPRFFLFFKNNTPLRYIRKYREQGETNPLEVPWEEWGPRESRMLHHQVPYQWLRYVHGYRVVFPLQSGNMQVLDFNVRKTKRHVFPQQPDSKASIEVIDYPSIILSDGIFSGPVETSLPYRVCRRDELKGFSGVMIDEQRLIGLKSPSFADGDIKDLYVFVF
ncbi:hypothetical protein DFJ58DRAFT_821238 [Suillus subalutaceus]|uniref:uncharacterized protein n=1 Tax=Suillus subalutaceus TaxID=48586 RepID=UPI001B866332|nr:uncharacterized protein DFJ58DRAFT_821238 [Suillus subalutaceus]KAG1834914.1 hypothetical protein DFJ58DRAFT_821238 [Suillus subalutaceus]